MKKMSEREIADTALGIAEANSVSFNKRRDFEWMVNIALWSGMIVLTGFRLSSDSPDRFSVSGPVICIFVAAVWGLHLFWLKGIYQRNKVDKYYKHLYLRVAENLIPKSQQELNEKDEGEVNKLKKEFGGWWWQRWWSHWINFSFTVILGVACGGIWLVTNPV